MKTRFRQGAILPSCLFSVLILYGVAPMPSGAGFAQQQQAKAKAQLPPLPLSPVEQAEQDGTAVHISLRDLTKLALQNNLDIAISDTNEVLYQQRVIQAYGPYDPALNIGLGAQSSRRPNTNLTNQSSAGNFNKTDFANWNFQFAQNIPTGGGITASYNSSRSDTNQAFALFSPQYNTSMSLQFTQPLNRNFRIDQTRGAIKLANLDTKLNDSQFRQTVTTTIATIQGMYWDLVGAIRDFQIKRESVDLARITLDNNSREVEIGVLAPISITEARANMASRQVDMISSRETILVAENNLRSVISPDRNAEIWHQVIVPAETADFVEYKVDLDTAIDTALKSRPELEQYGIQLEENGINYQMDRNQKKWQVDLVGTFGSVGVAGPQGFNPLTGKPLIDPNLIGGIGNANKLLFSGGFTNWFAGFNIGIPLRNRGLDAQLGQLKVQRQQLLMNRKSTEQKITVQVRNAIADLDTNKQRVETAKVAVELAQEQLTGETKRFQAGMSQNFLVLQRQQDLSTAKGTELQALVAYKKSAIALQQAMYTLLESNDFEIAKSVAR
ncbi:MAG TPA: TolC family protein [Acidobacteriota bacterium]|nr:TolC family protein [Acidobacteriota bacterium]